jgi:glycosyltransferase involved in cell wall biosynthesis
VTAPVRILHLHSTFSLGGKEARAVRLMNAFGAAATHTILSAVPDALGARDAIDRGIAVDFPKDAPSLAGLPGPARYRVIARYMQRFDLVLSYNWGSMDGVMARRMFAHFMRLPPLVHHEDGFNADEAEHQNPKRMWFRRLALPTAHALVVPSERLERIAREAWHQPARRVRRIANGIAVGRYAGPPDPQAIPGFVRRPGEVVIGTIAGLRAVKDLGRLIDALAGLDPHVRLVIVGEGPEREALVARATGAGVGARVLFAGFLDRPWRYVGAFDVLALSSLSEQFPIAVLEGMAAGLPVASTAVGDVAAMVSPENRDFVVPREPPRLLEAALQTLAGDGALRARIGGANRAKALTQYDEATMIAEYSNLYQSALSRPGSLTEQFSSGPL